MANANIYGRGLTGLIKRGFHEIPEVMASGVFGLIGLGLCAIACVKYYEKDMDNRRYKLQYTVYRDDDPRAAKVRKD